MPDSLAKISQVIFVIPIVLFAITIHEYAHARAALWCGDATAYMAGRLTLNPAAHLDLMGSLVFLMTMFTQFPFGWAKPVPVNFGQLRNPKRDMIIVAAAGPASNLVVGVASALCLRFMPMASSSPWAEGVLAMLVRSLEINCVLIAFNLLPIFPLDGSRIVSGFLPYPYSEQFERLSVYGPMILLLLMVTRVLDVVLNPILMVIFHGMMKVAGVL